MHDAIGLPEEDPSKLRQYLRAVALALPLALLGSSLYVACSGPLLPQRLTTPELELEVASETVSFDMESVHGRSQDGKRDKLEGSSLTLSFGNCRDHRLKLLVVGMQGAEASEPGTTAMLKVRTEGAACGARFSIVQHGQAPRETSSLPAAHAPLLLIKEGRRLVGDLRVRGLVAQDARVDSDNAEEVLLGGVQGKVALTATSMQLSRLALQGDQLALEFARKDMGFVKEAELDGDWALWEWRFWKLAVAIVVSLGPLIAIVELLQRLCRMRRRQSPAVMAP